MAQNLATQSVALALVKVQINTNARATQSAALALASTTVSTVGRVTQSVALALVQNAAPAPPDPDPGPGPIFLGGSLMMFIGNVTAGAGVALTLWEAIQAAIKARTYPGGAPTANAAADHVPPSACELALIAGTGAAMVNAYAGVLNNRVSNKDGITLDPATFATIPANTVIEFEQPVPLGEIVIGGTFTVIATF